LYCFYLNVTYAVDYEDDDNDDEDDDDGDDDELDFGTDFLEEDEVMKSTRGNYYRLININKKI
jgi:hypothetical protein